MKKLIFNIKNRQHLGVGVGIEATKGRMDVAFAMQVVDLEAQSQKDAGVSGKAAARMQCAQLRPC